MRILIKKKKINRQKVKCTDGRVTGRYFNNFYYHLINLKFFEVMKKKAIEEEVCIAV